MNNYLNCIKFLLLTVCLWATGSGFAATTSMGHTVKRSDVCVVAKHSSVVVHNGSIQGDTKGFLKCLQHERILQSEIHFLERIGSSDEFIADRLGRLIALRELRFTECFKRACKSCGIEPDSIDIKFFPYSSIYIIGFDVGKNAAEKKSIKDHYGSSVRKLLISVQPNCKSKCISEKAEWPTKSAVYVDPVELGDHSSEELLFLFSHELKHLQLQHLDKRFDLDESLKKKQKNIWYRYLASASIISAGLIGMITKHTTKSVNQLSGFKTKFSLYALCACIPAFGFIINAYVADRDHLKSMESSKADEFEADLESAKISKEHLIGGLQCAKRWESTPRYKNISGGPRDIHPSPLQRFNALKELAEEKGYRVIVGLPLPGSSIPQVYLV